MSLGYELDDYETEELEVWPDNWPAVRLFSRVLRRMRYPAMGGAPFGLVWGEVYPLMDRMELAPEEWDALARDVEVMEAEACSALAEQYEKRNKESNRG